METFSDNTSSSNSDADALYSSFDGMVVNNVMIEPEVDEFSESLLGGHLQAASCNVSNFAQEMNLEADSIPISNVDLDPQFIDPANEDFRITIPSSPAIDRCDDADGLASLSYDIVGTPRPLNFPGTSNGPGQRDVGAFEAKPDGYINNGIDLEASLVSDQPKTAALLEPHRFVLTVRNSGRNTSGMFTAYFGTNGGAISSLSSGRDINGNLGWSCDVGAGECSALLSLGPGGQMPPITLFVHYLTPGTRNVIANVLMQDGALIELTPGNNSDSDSVTVLDANDLFADGFED
jgi:hypothetical protein